jgi:hypothetical protein
LDDVRHARASNLLLGFLAVVALALAILGYALGGLAFVLGALAAVFLRARVAFLVVAGLLLVAIAVLATSVDSDECGGDCFELAGRGFDPFVLLLSIPLNVLGWCLGLLVGRALRPVVLRGRPS